MVKPLSAGNRGYHSNPGHDWDSNNDCISIASILQNNKNLLFMIMQLQKDSYFIPVYTTSKKLKF